MRQRVGFWCAAVLALTGCATPYVPPTGPTATLTMVGRYTRVYISDDGSCNRALVERGQTVMPIAAEKRIWITQSWRDAIGACELQLSIRPDAGQPYTTEFQVENRRCTMRISRLLPNGKSVPEPTVQEGSKPTCSL